MKYFALITVFLTCSISQAQNWDMFAPPPEKVECEQARPEVRVYYAPFYCPPCEELKKHLSCVPFVNFVAYAPPAWVRSYPTIHWKGENGKWYQHTGSDLQEFVRKYRETNPSEFKVEFDVIEAKEINYPIRGGFWSVGNEWNPSRSQVIYHLKYGAEHRGKFTDSFLGKLSLNELQSLHSDDHESRVKWSKIPGRKQPTTTYQPPARSRRRIFRSCPTCPY